MLNKLPELHELLYNISIYVITDFYKFYRYYLLSNLQFVMSPLHPSILHNQIGYRWWHFMKIQAGSTQLNNSELQSSIFLYEFNSSHIGRT